MKFISYDSIERSERETEIRGADSDTVRDFKLTWDPYVDEKIVREKDRDFNYRCFEWDRLIRLSIDFGFDYSCFAAYTGTRLDGLLTLRNQNDDKMYLDFFASAPWNYFGTAGKMRRIGSGLVFFTIRTSFSSGLGGEFFLYAIEDAERYCERIGMIPTGQFKYGLREYHMTKEKAAVFEEGFRNFIMSE